ncbi:MAG: LamG domain-containing protein [Sedimentisphaerales bacterium]|nr:LamG domain-containing protein [Sedimentisphaerales bacterium]
MCKKLLYLVSFILVLNLALVSGAKAADPNLVGVWLLNEGSGDIAIDLSGNGNDGTINNADTGGLGDGGSVWVNDPERGTVISFNGTADSAFVRAGDIPQMTLTNDFTWSFWAKHSEENTADNDIILGNRMDENAVDFVPRQFIKFTPTKFEWHMNGNGDDNMEYDDIPADIWLHHAVVKTGDQLTYYRNGIEGGSGTITQPLDFPQPLFFGGDNEAAEGENWSGFMSEVRIYDRALSANEIGQLAGTPVDPGTDGLVAYYAMENDVLDSSGNSNDGTIIGAPTFVDGLSGYGMAMEFDGESYVDVGNDTSLDITGPISMGIWIRPGADDPEGNGTETAVMAKADSAGSPSWSWQVRYGWNSPQPYMAFTFNTSPRAWVYVGKNLERGEWAHIACSHDGTTLKCYLNGEETDSTPMGAITSSPTPVLIGSDGWRSDWIGAIDEVVIYDRALSESEVMYLAGERPMPVDPGTYGLVAFYALDGDANDSSGNELHGTIVGDPNFVEGKVGMALELDGVDDYVDSGNPPQLVITEAISIACWVNPVQLDGEQGFAGLDAGYSFKAHGEGVRFTTPGILDHSSANLALEAGVWQHVAATFQPGQDEGLVFYLNGVETERMTSSAINTGSGPFRIGNNQWNELLTGLIDEVAIYGRILSAGEIRYLAGERAVDPSLVIYYDFDEVSDIVADQSGKGHDGVVMGAVTAEPDGKIGGAANFTSGGYLDLDGPSFPAEDIPTSAITLAAWIKMANTGGDHEIFNARASDETWILHPEPKSSGDIRWLLRSYGGTTIFQIRTGTVTWDQWLHFAGTYDKESGMAALYINGELIEEMVVENPADIAGDWGLGARVGKTIDDARPFTGLMDEFRMYTRALSQNEILEVMQGM